MPRCDGTLRCLYWFLGRVCAPLSLVLLKDLALGVVTQSADVDEAAQIELLGTEHRHLGRIGDGAVVGVVAGSLMMLSGIRNCQRFAGEIPEKRPSVMWGRNLWSLTVSTSTSTPLTQSNLIRDVPVPQGIIAQNLTDGQGAYKACRPCFSFDHRNPNYIL